MSYGYVGAPALFNGSLPDGGDSAKINLNQWYQSGDQAYIIICSCMVLVMIPGIGFLYSGLARRKSALSMIWAAMASFSVVTIQWYFWGYSLAFSSSGTSGFIGNLEHIGLRHTLGEPSPGSPLIPELLYAFYQMQFCATTGAIVTGAIAERGRLIPMMVFIFCWATIVYCPIAYWAWNINGWTCRDLLRCLSSGIQHDARKASIENDAQLQTSQCLSRDTWHDHTVVWMAWVQWRECIWCKSQGSDGLLELLSHGDDGVHHLVSARLQISKEVVYGWLGKSSALCLVAATPASGFIPPWASIILGVVVGIVSNFSTKIKFWIRIDDSMDNLAEHGIAGMVGLIFNGLFAADYIIGLDGVSTGIINGGWLNHNYKQLYIQIAYIVACTAYSFVVSAAIAGLINLVPGLNLRASEEAEMLGMDDDQLGEFAYDYVEVRRDYLAWTPETQGSETIMGVDLGRTNSNRSNRLQPDPLRMRQISSRTVGHMDGEISPQTPVNQVQRVTGDEVIQEKLGVEDAKTQ
ncbi:related to ammonium transporter MEAA [Phialocephala subalpina]|uniref:Related to ammonium transporter MEAA n=1 Tax=Phialocephala subalpina TaxID=576137 RepID=A0A1L7XKA6_9HELO|nr:related to ammonium transporter MEAA [Phialocephala subalpina]